jgi:hypothetical protein
MPFILYIPQEHTINVIKFVLVMDNGLQLSILTEIFVHNNIVFVQYDVFFVHRHSIGARSTY